MKEGIAMIILPESIKRILKRIEATYEQDIKAQKSYYPTVIKDGITYTGTDTVRILLESFKEFKASLEDGTSKLLRCTTKNELKAKIKLMRAVFEWYEPLSIKDIERIEGDVYLQFCLRTKVKALINRPATQKEAGNLLGFINNAYSSSWGQDDWYYKVKDFRLVNSKEDLQKILAENSEAKDLTASERNRVVYTTIRVVMVPMDYATIYHQKGLLKEYQDFCKQHISDEKFEEEVKAFHLWNDVRETAIYYIYIPQK